MARGDKAKYTDKQKCKASLIEEQYERRGVSVEEAERRAWATVNKADGGGKKPGGSGRKTSAESTLQGSASARRRVATHDPEAMMKCEVCGNDYDKAFTVTVKDTSPGFRQL